MSADRDVGNARDRRALVWIAILVALWAFELLLVQEYTSQPSEASGLILTMKGMARRLMLDVLTATFLVCVLRPVALYVTFGIGLVLCNVLIVYAEYFGAPLSWPVISHQWQEGLQVADHGMTLLRWPALLMLLAVAAVKVGLRERLRSYVGVGTRLRRAGWIAAAAYVVWAIGLAGVVKPISKIRYGSPEYCYGYGIAWVAEGVFFNKARVLQWALDAAQQRSDCLSPLEAPLELAERVAIVQVESLDWDVIDARAKGEWVMPFLRDLKTRSMLYAVCPMHKTGTSDADFTLLTDRMPNGRIPPFKVEDFPYQNTLPQRLHRQGYCCIAMHGNTGNFFYRRPAYRQMGFSEIYFAEELGQAGCPMRDGQVDDEELLNLSAKWLNEASGPTVHFIITLTSHGPFDKLPPGKKELFLRPASQTEAYLNSMRYVDRALAAYVAALPQGTELVLYGDHESRVQGYRREPKSRTERVPWLIYCKGRDLAAQQQTRDMPWSQSGEIQMLDAVSYLHGSLHESRVAGRPPAASDRGFVR